MRRRIPGIASCGYASQGDEVAVPQVQLHEPGLPPGSHVGALDL